MRIYLSVVCTSVCVLPSFIFTSKDAEPDMSVSVPFFFHFEDNVNKRTTFYLRRL